MTFQANPFKCRAFCCRGAGGCPGSSFRQRIEELKLLPQPMVIVNVPGGGATIGIRKAQKAKPDGIRCCISIKRS